MIAKLKAKLSSDVHFSELLKGSSIAFIYRILGIGLGYLFTLIITRGYGAEAMGVYALAFTVMQIVVVVSSLGMDTAMLRLTGSNANKTNGMSFVREIYKKIIYVIFPTTILTAFVLYFLAPLISQFIFHKESLTSAFQLAALGIAPMVLVYLHREALRGLKKIAVYSFFNNIAIPMFATLFLLLLYFWDTEYRTMPLIAQIAAITSSATLAVYLWRKALYGIDNHEKAEHITYSALFSMSFPMMLASSMFMVMSWTDTLMLGMFSSEKEVGIYNVALKVSTLTSIALIAVNAIAAPKFAEMWGNKDTAGLEKIVRQSTKMIFWSAFPILAVFLLFPYQLLSLFGEAFGVGALALVILTTGQFVNAISGSVNYLLNMTGHEKIVQNNILVACVINIFLNYLLIPLYGIEGAATASMVSMVFWNLAAVFYIERKLGIITIYIPLIKRFYK